MPVDRVQCPACGANLAVEGRDSQFCSYCGAKLRVRTGPSGNPMAVLDGIKEDTSLMARRTALAHIEEELTRVQVERQRQIEDGRARLAALDDEGALGLVAFLPVVSLLVGVALVAQVTKGNIWQATVGVVLTAGSLGVFAIWNRQDARKDCRRAVLEETLNRALAEVDAKAGAMREKAAALRAEIDRSIEQM